MRKCCAELLPQATTLSREKLRCRSGTDQRRRRAMGTMPRVVAAPPATYPYRRQAHWSLTTYAALSSM